MKIENYAEANPADKYVAEFSVYLPAIGITIHKFRVLRGKKGGFYFVYPSYGKPTVHPEEKRQYFPYFEFTSERKKEFDAKVNELLKEFVR
jgi:hypothetical protein